MDEGYQQLVTRFGTFQSIKGPGVIWHIPLVEGLGPLAYVGGDMVDKTFTNVIARDVVPVKIRMTCFFVYEPQAPSKAAKPGGHFHGAPAPKGARTRRRAACSTQGNCLGLV